MTLALLLDQKALKMVLDRSWHPFAGLVRYFTEGLIKKGPKVHSSILEAIYGRHLTHSKLKKIN